MNVKDAEEIINKIDIIGNKYYLMVKALPFAKGVINEDQRDRLNTQLSDVINMTDRVLKNLILLEEQIVE